jgi:predicted PurR-regulated permease PerM
VAGVMSAQSPRRKLRSDEGSTPPKLALRQSPRQKKVARLVLVLVLALLAFWLARDFLAPIGWAVIVAIATWPLYVRFASRFREPTPTLAPLLFTIVVGVMLLLPIFLTVNEVAQDSDTIAQWFKNLQQHGIAVPPWLSEIPVAGEAVSRWWQTNLSNPNAASSWLGSFDPAKVLSWIPALGGQFLYQLLFWFVMLTALFLLFQRGATLSDQFLEAADRLFGEPGERLASKLVVAVRDTVNGTVVVAVIEGTLIGIVYALAGVPHAVLFGLLTIAFAMLPFGAWAAFTAAALLLLLSGGSFWSAALVMAFGSLIMLIGDNFLWPALVRGTAQLPFLLAFIGIFGGLQTFGLLGLFIGATDCVARLARKRSDLSHSFELDL